MSLLVATGGIVRARQLRAPLIDYSTDLTFTRSGEAANFDPRTGAFLAAAGTDWREDEHTLPLAISSWTDAGTPGETTGVSDHLGGSDAVTTEDADAGAFEGHTHSTGFSVVAGRLYRTTTWIKKDTDETRFPELQNVSSSGFAHWQLNTKTGAATVRVSNGFTDLSLSVTEAVSGWWRVIFTFRPNISAGFLARVYPAAAVSLGGSALATTTGALTWYPAIQLDGEAAWLPTDVPRILDDGAILIEGAATNRVTHSQDFDNAFWSKLTDPPTVTANSATAPDGTTTADEILFNSAAGVGDLRSGALGLTDSLDYAYSVFLQSPADAPASVRTSMRNKASTDIRTVRAVPATWTLR